MQSRATASGGFRQRHTAPSAWSPGTCAPSRGGPRGSAPSRHLLRCRPIPRAPKAARASRRPGPARPADAAGVAKRRCATPRPGRAFRTAAEAHRAGVELRALRGAWSLSAGAAGERGGKAGGLPGTSAGSRLAVRGDPFPGGGPSPWRRGDDGTNGGRRRGTVCLPSHLRLPPWRLPLSRPALRALGSPLPSGLLRSAAGEADWRGRRARGSASPAMDLLLPGGSMGAFRLLNTVLERLVPPPSPAQPVRWKWRNIWTSLAHSLLSGSWALLGWVEVAVADGVGRRSRPGRGLTDPPPFSGRRFYFYPPMGEDLIDHFSPSAHCLLGISIGKCLSCPRPFPDQPPAPPPAREEAEREPGKESAAAAAV
ncbi:TLC domain-containing protein 2 [Crotalus adamanteus]|uniref:TLC domain-containing protein 2 n=1 Tax=Crotalus adamanteus TaxID=8729 RepID=A0AAW1CEH9_CROAD